MIWLQDASGVPKIEKTKKNQEMEMARSGIYERPWPYRQKSSIEHEFPFFF